MAKLFRVMLPNKQKEITLSLPYGQAVFYDGDDIPESYITKLYPDFFVEVPSANPVVEKWKEVIESPVTAENGKVELLKSEEQPVKKKAGRPFGTTKDKLKGK